MACKWCWHVTSSLPLPFVFHDHGKQNAAAYLTANTICTSEEHQLHQATAAVA